MASDLYHERLALAEDNTRNPMDPELERLLKSGGPWPDPPFTDITQCRSISDYADSLLAKTLGSDPPGLQEQTIVIPTRDPSFTSMATLTCPDHAAPGFRPGPLIVLYHPGGFFLGSPTKLTMYARPLARLFDASVLCPSYRFAPECPFPTGIEDAWDVLQWAAAHATTHLSADPERKGFLVGGISSGANFAVALTRCAITHCLRPPITGTWAPIFMGLSAGQNGSEGNTRALPAAYSGLLLSHEQHPDALVIDKLKAQTMWEYYKPGIESLLFNPLAAPLDGLAGMPKVVLQVAGHDLFRDDGLVLAHALRDHGVEVRLEVYPGVCHSFWVFAPELTVSRKFVRDIAIGFAWLLDVEVETLETGWETAMTMPPIKVDGAS